MNLNYRFFALWLLLAFPAVLLGCRKSSKEVTLAELQQLVVKAEGSTMWRGTYYWGTDGEFHYVRHSKEGLFGKEDLFVKIKTNALPIPDVRPYPLPRGSWVRIADIVLTNKSQYPTNE